MDAYLFFVITFRDVARTPVQAYNTRHGVLRSGTIFLVSDNTAQRPYGRLFSRLRILSTLNSADRPIASTMTASDIHVGTSGTIVSGWPWLMNGSVLPCSA